MMSPRPTLVVQLLGGLGNQMFQAAAGLALARRHDARLVFDLSRFRARGLRGYALAGFALDAEIKTGEQGAAARIRRLIGKLTHPDRAKIPGWWHGAIYSEPHFRFDPAFEALRPDLLISGYFQSPRYFAGMEAEIAAAFAPEKLASATALDLAAELAGENTVAIHVRRGDYAADPRAFAVHGTLPDDYYARATAHIRHFIPDARFFVFSDTPSEAATLAQQLPNAQTMAGTSAGDDLFLMSRARHHIIANSSFSWWSAWLDRRPGGMRIAPEAWFTPEALASRPVDDLLPEEWIRL